MKKQKHYLQKLIKTTFKKNNIPIFVLLFFYLCIYIFFYDKVLFTPDFGQSDAYHLNFSLKYYLAQELKENRLPFWTDQLMGGYPLFAEGQIGALFLPNLLFVKFLPFHISYNLLYISALFSLSLGMYILLREYKVNKWLALIISLNFTFSGVISLRLVHLNLIQAISLFPFLFYFIKKYLENNRYRYFLISLFIISQMIFTGHPQSLFISLVTIGLWILGKQIKSRGSSKVYFIYPFLKFFLLIFLAVLISLPQLIPSLELSKESYRSLSTEFKNVVAYPFNIENTIHFFSPFYFGNPKEGSYPAFSNDWGIFWENTPYIGEIAFIVSLLLVLYTFTKKNKFTANVAGYLFLIFILFLLVLGKNSPLYFLFYYPPFSFFRTQSRFLIPIVFFIFFMTGYITSHFKFDRKILYIIILLFTINLGVLLKFTYEYHLFIDYQKAIVVPPLLKNVLESENMYSLDFNSEWNEIFFSSGWQSNEEKDYYLFLNNYAHANSNLIYNKSILSVNTPGLWLRRPKFFENSLDSYLLRKDETVEITKEANNLIELLNLKHLITSKPVAGDINYTSQKVNKGDNEVILTSFNDIDRGLYYLPLEYNKATYVEDIDKFLRKTDSLKKAAILEQNLRTFDNSTIEEITVHKLNNQTLLASTNNKNPSFIVFHENDYPGWELYIDGDKSSIIPSNLLHIGAYIPPGDHEIILRFEPSSFLTGIYISFFSLIMLVVFPYRSKVFNRIKLRL